MANYYLNGTLNGSGGVSGANALTLSSGGSSWKAPATGYYIICMNLRSTVSTTTAAHRTILIRLDMANFWYGTMNVPPISGTYTTRSNLCFCIFFKTNDTMSFGWLNVVGITSAVTGTFSITRIFPTNSVSMTLTCTIPVNTWVQPTLGILEISDTSLVKNNIYTCMSSGKYYISLLCGSQTGIGNTTQKVTLRCNVKSSNVTTTYLSENLNVSTAVSWGTICKIVDLKLNDEITFTIRNPVMADTCYYGRCIIFKLI